MSNTIDNKVVSMQFDNKHFESNVQTTLGTLDKLKRSLNLTGATKGLENVDAAAKKVDMTTLGGAVETVGTRFSSLQVMAVTALANITNSAVNAGKRIVSALTIQPVTTGFSEYETQINAVQTILANTESKGTTLQQVNSALDTLNTYADKTIYNFTEMTKNIGTFTAAGVDLDTSVQAIQGIANLAAVSGSTSQQASTAMYQLSQALSSGTVKLMDWNSVVNAGMGGQVFQDALKETARNHGVAIDQMIKDQGSFRETLQEGWLTSEILTETLSHFTMAAEEGTEEWNAYKKSLMDQGYTAKQAEEIIKLSNTATNAATKVKTFTQLWDTLKESVQSGWTQTWEIVIGDFEEAKGFLTEVSDKIGGMIGASAEARNAILSEGLSSGWKQLMGAGIADEAGYKETFADVAKDHGVSIDKMIAKEKELDSSLSDSEAYQKALKKGLTDGSLSADMMSESVHKMADKMSKMSAEELKAAGYTQEHVKQIKDLSKGLKDGEISMDDFVKKITRTSGRENIIQALWNAFDGLLSVIEPIKQAFGDVFKPLTGEQLYSFTQALVKFTEKMTISGETADKIRRTFAGIFATFKIGIQIAKALFGGVKSIIEYFAPASEGLLTFTANLGDSLVEISQGNKVFDIFSKALQKIGSFLKPIADGVKTVASSILNSFTTISDKAEVRLGPLAVIGNAIKAIFSGIGKIIEKVAPWVIKAVTGIGEVFTRFMDKIASSIQGADYNTLFDTFNSGVIAAIGVFIAKFIKSGGDLLDNASGFIENFKDILGGVKEAIGAFTESIKAETLKRIATAIGILAVSLLVISLIDSEKMTSSLTAITILFTELMGAMSLFGKIVDKDSIGSLGKISRAMIGLSTALLILAAAMKIMGSMSWEEMGVGLTATVVGLGALVGAIKLLPEKNVNKAAKAIKKLSSALVVFAVAMKIMSTMSWEEMGVALVTMAVGLGVLVGALRILPKNISGQAIAMVALASAMVVLAGALKLMATMTWDDVARSLVALGGSLVALAGAMHLMKNAKGGAFAMFIIAPALLALSGALKIISSMTWEEIAKGLVTLAGSLIVIAGAVQLMKKTVGGAAALLIVAAALAILTPVLKSLGSMSWGDIAKGLVALAGAFLVIGIAGKMLKPLVPTILKLSGALALLGLACAAIGAGVLMIGIGLSSIAAAGTGVAVAIVSIVSGIVGLIPFIIEQIGVGILKFCDVIAGGVSSICAAVKAVVIAVVDAVVTCVPEIVEGILVLIGSLLEALVNYVPTIVKLVFDFLITLIDEIAKRLPDLIQAGVNLLMSFFQGVIDALKTVDPEVLVNGLLAVGMLSALMVAMASMAALAPAAMVGVVAMGVVIAELAVVLAAIGALAQVPGLEWLISEGGDFLQKVGTAIGQFLGGIVGGFAQGVSSSLPQIGSDLSTFMTNAMPFVNGVKAIDSAALEGTKSLVGVIMAITAANVFESLTAWLTGESSLTKFGEEIAAFAPYIVQYAETVKGIDVGAVQASATAAQCLSELAANLPNSGGVASWFAGENDIGTFGEQLIPFGKGMKAYSDAIVGFNPEAVIASASAAKAIADMASIIPNEGGVVSWFAGENSIASFGDQLVTLGKGLKGYSDAIAGVDTEAIVASAGAAKALADMTACIPNEGGVAAWFAGENSIANFANQLELLGNGLKKYSDATIGIDPSAIIASSNAAKALADMTSSIPNSGGVVAWFTGENNIASFADQLPVLGSGLKGFSDAIAGIVPENIVAASTAAKSLAEMTGTIPNEGGVVAWFTGENSITKFAEQLAPLGKGLKGFSDSVTGIVPENVVAAANAAKSLAEMASVIPTEGGVKAWFTGETSIANFADQLPELGKGLKGFSDSVTGIVPENVTAAASAAKSLGEMASVTPTNTDKLPKFGENLNSFGEKLKTYFDKMAGVAAESIAASTNAINAVKDVTSALDAGAIKSASKAIDGFADTIKDLSKVKASSADGFASAIKKLAQTNVDALIKAFSNAGSDMKKAGQAALDKFIEGAESRNSNMNKAGKTAIEKFVDGVEGQESKVKKACTKLVSTGADAISTKSSSFKSAGKDLGAGLVEGINAKQTAVYEAAFALGQKAVQGEKDGQKSKSPSKLTMLAGKWLGEGLIIGMDKMDNLVYKSGYGLGETATDTISSAIAKVADYIDSDMDAQPTIRPVLDLSDVKAGASTIGGMFSDRTLSVNAQTAGIVSASMAGRQNGNDSKEIVSAIKALRKDISEMPREAVNINGITYSGDSEINNAVQTLVRAVRVGGRS